MTVRAHPFLLTVAAIGGMLMLQGCSDDQDTDQGNEAAEVAANTLLKPAPDLPKPWVDPIDLGDKSDLLDFEYVIPPEAAARKPLRDWMTEQAERLKALALKAARDDKQSSDEGGFAYRQHSDGTRWAATADTRSLMSFQGQHYFYTGGAHPMVNYLSLLYDRQKGEILKSAGDMFSDPAAAGAYIHPLVCKRLDELRLQKRGGKTETSDMFGGCPKLGEGTLLPVSTTPKKIDKLRVIFDPYVAGPYVEGEYVVELPIDQSIIDLVKPEYQGVFISG